MSLGISIGAPIYSGGGSSPLVPHPYPVAIGGRAYMVDYSHDIAGFRGQFFHHRSIPPLRESTDSSSTFGDQSLNPEGLARWTFESWHRGAGQVFSQHTDSDPFRFRSSKGVDVWTKGEISLLPDTAAKRSSANTNLRMVTAGGYLYLTDGTGIRRTADMVTWTALTGIPATAGESICSDGYNVYSAHGSDGIYKALRGAGSTASYATGTVDLVAYVKGRLMAAAGAAIYNVITNTLPSALFTQANSDFVWVGFAEGKDKIYAAGYSGDKSLIYRIDVVSDATTLSAPIIAGELPDGEIVRSVQGYLGYLLIGTDKGVRFAQPDTNGDLTIGALIPTPGAVACFEPQDRFVWFGWTNYDTASTGLGRLDLTQFVATLTPAYASDLMAAGQGAVQSVVTFLGGPVFTVSGLGVYAETTDKVASGTLDSGFGTYGVVDPKVAVFLDVRTSALAGSVKSSLSVDGGTFALIGSATIAGTTFNTFNTSQPVGFTLETRHELDRSAVDTTTGPTILQQTLRANPVPSTGFEIVVPCVITTMENVDGQERRRDPTSERAFLEGLRTTGTLFTYQEGNESWAVLLTDLTWLPHHPTGEDWGESYEALAIVTMKTIS